MDPTSVSSDYVRFSELAFVLVRDPVAAEVIAVDTVLAATRRTLAPDAPPGIQRAKRKLAQQAMGYMRRRRLSRLLPWKKDRPDGLELPPSAREVWDALASLSARQQVAVVMARLDGGNLAEVADVLDCSAAAANAQLERGRKGLSERLGSDDADLRSLLTRELRVVARAFTQAHHPDPTMVGTLMRSNRWRAWVVSAGVLAVAAAAAFSFLR